MEVCPGFLNRNSGIYLWDFQSLESCLILSLWLPNPQRYIYPQICTGIIFHISSRISHMLLCCCLFGQEKRSCSTWQPGKAGWGDHKRNPRQDSLFLLFALHPFQIRALRSDIRQNPCIGLEQNEPVGWVTTSCMNGMLETQAGV